MEFSLYDEKIITPFIKLLDECGCDDCCATTMCLPIKFPLTLPCFIGSMINGCINKLKSTTEKNYLF